VTSRTLALAYLVAVLGAVQLVGLLLLPRLWPGSAPTPADYVDLASAVLLAVAGIGGVYGARHLRVSGPAAPTSSELVRQDDLRRMAVREDPP